MKKTQKATVAEILKRDGYIDNYSAIDARLTVRLGAIIKVLRDEGWKIDGGYIGGTKNWKYTLSEQRTKTISRYEQQFDENGKPTFVKEVREEVVDRGIA